MTTERITIRQYCIHHHTDVSFIDALEQSGLIATISEAEERYIEPDHLEELESYTRWYLDLDINVEGIETIHYLLQKLKDQQYYIHQLENRLHRYEAEG